MLVIGLTGGIAAGKTTSVEYLRAHNIPLVDADVIARQVVEPGQSAYNRLRRAFGSEYFDEVDGTLNREKLGELIFRDHEKRRLLNSITHPAIRKQLVFAVFRAFIRGERMVVVDVPLLFESRLEKFFSKIIVIHCSDERQLERLCRRDQLTLEQALNRVHAQLPMAHKVHRATFAVNNDGSVKELTEQLDEVIAALKSSWYPFIFRTILAFITLSLITAIYMLF